MIKTTLLATSAAICLAGAASAATIAIENGGTISAGQIGVGNGFTSAGETVSFTYTAATDIQVLDFVSVSSVGFNGGDDLALVDFGYTSTAFVNIADDYDAFSLNGATTSASSSLPGFDLMAGESFTIFFEYGAGGSATTSHQYSFATAPLAAIPLPASILLLGAALGGLGVAKRRKTVAA